MICLASPYAEDNYTLVVSPSCSRAQTETNRFGFHSRISSPNGELSEVDPVESSQTFSCFCTRTCVFIKIRTSLIDDLLPMMLYISRVRRKNNLLPKEYHSQIKTKFGRNMYTEENDAKIQNKKLIPIGQKHIQYLCLCLCLREGEMGEWPRP